MFKCKNCGCSKFVAHQVIRADIVVDGDNIFEENLPGGLESAIYDSSVPYGPYICTNCGMEYDELKE